MHHGARCSMALRRIHNASACPQSRRRILAQIAQLTRKFLSF